MAKLQRTGWNLGRVFNFRSPTASLKVENSDQTT